MTRETKIGLLVGLAFIIVIGILLSDHLTSATEPPQAPLAQAGNDVRRAVAVPGGNTAPQVSTVVSTGPIAPQDPVPTRQELTQRPPVAQVQVGPANTESPVVVATQDSMSTSANITTNSDPQVDSSLQHVASVFNEELVAVNPDPATTTVIRTPTPQRTTTASASSRAAREYKAEPGDTLSHMAARFFGSNTKANRDAIIKANPSLQQNPDLIIAGRTYIIPAASGDSATVASATERPAQPSSSSTTSRNPSGERIYIVKPGDNLTKIAIEQLGTAAAVHAIIELNKDVLRNGDVIHPNMRLRLPARPERLSFASELVPVC